MPELKKSKLAFVDLETTGLDPSKHEIIEIGCLIAKPRENGRGWDVASELELKVKPQHLETAEPEALRVNGYNDGDWLFAPDLASAMKTLAEEIDDAIVVAQNVTFDWSFLERAFTSTKTDPNIFYHKMDLASMAYGKLFQRENFQKITLRGLCDYFQVKNSDAHSALADTRASFEVFQKLMAL